MEQAASPTISEKPLPSPPPDGLTNKRSGHVFTPTRSPARVSSQTTKVGTHTNGRTLQIRALEAENSMLKAEVVRNYELQLRSEKMVEDVRAATERLRDAVLQFRREQKHIEDRFREEQKRIDSEFQASNYF